VRLLNVRAYWASISAFTTLLRANTAATRRLNEQLIAEYALTVEEYEVLVRLARAGDLRMRQVDLAEQPLLTASNLTRLLDGLERRGLVDRHSSAEGGRVVYVALTDAGRATVLAATRSHFAQVEELFGSLFDDEEAESLQALLVRLTREPS
jgi:MarR family transcriptional regulator, 2-MHQ and catechol-resistance regulon repressor